MKKYFLFLFCFSFATANSQTPGEWTWMNGDTIPLDSGHYGIQGIPDPLNHPPELYEAANWVDLQGNFWLYAGTRAGGNENGNLWKFDPDINMWTWINGPGDFILPPVFGIKGVASPSNYPGFRSLNSCTWIDAIGDLWMFGGLSGSYGQGTNDLWKYNIPTNMWTWISGDTSLSLGIYGTQGVPSVNNIPGSRDETSTAWIEGNNLWLFGGAFDYGGFPPPEHWNDLWKYDITTNEWAWMKGSSITNVGGVYGTQGVSDPANTPSSRWSYSHWKDQAGNFWTFGGAPHFGYDNLNELWKYNPAINEWTWISGSYLPSNGTYHDYCIADTSNIPSSRYRNTACWTDSCGMFWMFGGRTDDNGYMLNDLWAFDPYINVWTFISGDSISGDHWAIYGVKEISSPSNTPGNHAGSSSWIDKYGNLWLFGGSMNNGLSYTAMWRYVPDSFCHGCLQTSTQQNQLPKFQFEIIPNPASDIFTITNSPFSIVSISIFNMIGEKVYAAPVDNHQRWTIDCRSFPNGIYFVQVQTDNGTAIQKLVKQ